MDFMAINTKGRGNRMDKRLIIAAVITAIYLAFIISQWITEPLRSLWWPVTSQSNGALTEVATDSLLTAEQAEQEAIAIESVGPNGTLF